MREKVAQKDSEVRNVSPETGEGSGVFAPNPSLLRMVLSENRYPLFGTMYLLKSISQPVSRVL